MGGWQQTRLSKEMATDVETPGKGRVVAVEGGKNNMEAWDGLPLDGANGLTGIYLQPLASSVQDLRCGNRSLLP